MIGEILAIFSAFCWALNGAIYKVGLRYGRVIDANFVRVTLTAAGFSAIMLARGELFCIAESLSPRIWAMLFASAVFAFFIGDSLYMAAIRMCGVSRAVPLSSTYPLFVALWTAILFGRFELNAVIGAILIVIAIKMIVEGNGELNPSGYALAISAAIFWSLSIMIVKNLTRYLPAEAVAGFRFAIVSALLLPLILKRGFSMNARCFRWMTMSSLVLIAGNYAFVYALSVSSATEVSTISSVYPVISQLLAVVVEERLNIRIVAGTILATIGVMVVCV